MVMVNTKYLIKVIRTQLMHHLFYKVPKDISRLFLHMNRYILVHQKWIVDTSIAKKTKRSLR